MINWKSTLTAHIEREDLGSAIHFYKCRTGGTLAEARTLVYAHYRKINGCPEPTQKFVGYHDDDELPIKPGMTVTILKGTVIKTIGQEPRKAGRTYKVRVDHILNGSFPRQGYHNFEESGSNPTVRWPGSGGYWSSVDINDIPEAGTS